MVISQPYNKSTILKKIHANKKNKLPVKIAFLDIDSTLTGDPEDAVRVRRLLNQQSYGVVFVTSRTEEMLMSRKEFEKSQENGLVRRRPRLKLSKKGERIRAFADDMSEFAGLYNPDIIASGTGTKILVRQASGGYLEDRKYTLLMRDNPESWRKKTLKILRIIDPKQEIFKLAPIDVLDNFNEGKTDVEPPHFRVQLFFEPQRIDRVIEETKNTNIRAALTEEEKLIEAGKKMKFLKKLEGLKKSKNLPEELRKHLDNVRVNDDSHPDRGKFCVYLTPIGGTKARAVKHIIDDLSSAVEVSEMLYVGDSMPDLHAGLYAGYKAKTRKFLLVSGSRLTAHLIINSIKYFAGEPLFHIKNKMEKGNGNGEMVFSPTEQERSRLIIGEYAYPGTRYVSTVRAFLESQSRL